MSYVFKTDLADSLRCTDRLATDSGVLVGASPKFWGL